MPSDSAPERATRSQPIGSLLRRTREGRRISLAEAAASLRIRAAYLEAIEQGAYEQLPGRAYAVGFVRTYADYLGLDGEEAARRFKLDGQGLDPTPDLALPMPIAERSMPGGRFLVAALVLAICGYGLWYYLGSGNRHQPETVAAVPPSLVNESATPSEAKAAVSEVPTQPPKPAPENAAPASAAPETAAPATPAPETVAAAVATEPPPPPAATGQVFGVVVGPTRIVLRFTADCWIQIKGGGPDAAFGKLMHAGDLYRVPDQPGLVARVGDSGSLVVLLDGKPVTLPPAASRVRNIALDPVQLAALAGPPVATPAAAASPAGAD
jgi:cytoskeleton protein RodZ